jgi:hypothetical protein
MQASTLTIGEKQKKGGLAPQWRVSFIALCFYRRGAQCVTVRFCCQNCWLFTLHHGDHGFYPSCFSLPSVTASPYFVIVSHFSLHSWCPSLRDTAQRYFETKKERQRERKQNTILTLFTPVLTTCFYCTLLSHALFSAACFARSHDCTRNVSLPRQDACTVCVRRALTGPVMPHPGGGRSCHTCCVTIVCRRAQTKGTNATSSQRSLLPGTQMRCRELAPCESTHNVCRPQFRLNQNHARS